MSTAVLFVCMGNICRSPLAEGVFRAKAAARGVSECFEVDSAGTGGWHAGEPADARMRGVAASRGIPLESRARQVVAEDFERFDLLLCADRANERDLLDMGAPRAKVRLLLSYLPDSAPRDIPDPYYGADRGFEQVFDLVDMACDRLLDALTS